MNFREVRDETNECLLSWQCARVRRSRVAAAHELRKSPDHIAQEPAGNLLFAPETSVDHQISDDTNHAQADKTGGSRKSDR